MIVERPLVEMNAICRAVAANTCGSVFMPGAIDDGSRRAACDGTA